MTIYSLKNCTTSSHHRGSSLSAPLIYIIELPLLYRLYLKQIDILQTPYNGFFYNTGSQFLSLSLHSTPQRPSDMSPRALIVQDFDLSCKIPHAQRVVKDFGTRSILERSYIVSVSIEIGEPMLDRQKVILSTNPNRCSSSMEIQEGLSRFWTHRCGSRM